MNDHHPRDRGRLGRVPAHVAALYSQPNGATEPAFLGPDYVCTELPTHITLLTTREIEERRKRLRRPPGAHAT
jgi:hypothetical protein